MLKCVAQWHPAHSHTAQASPPHSLNTNSCSISPTQAASLLLSALDFTTLGTWSSGIVAAFASTTGSFAEHGVIRVVARVSMAFSSALLFKADECSIVWMGHTVLISIHHDGHWGCFHLLAAGSTALTFFQVSCLCLEESVENDPCKFALTSRTGDVVETFVLHSSSPSVRQTWIHEINQILENQRNFLNGNACSAFFL